MFKVRKQISSGQNACHRAENDQYFEFFGIFKLTSYMQALQKKRRLQVTFVLLTNMISSRPLC